ncbi:MAG: hypothetical protein RMJ67_01240 [Elusimicrobiota bacterium]|nr:hypothetical protein [Endomicrobiia bacterium]MDW8165128.1 hypothetical protein [Elusimicrobiota bacterium]
MKFDYNSYLSVKQNDNISIYMEFNFDIHPMPDNFPYSEIEEYFKNLVYEQFTRVRFYTKKIEITTDKNTYKVNCTIPYGKILPINEVRNIYKSINLIFYEFIIFKNANFNSMNTYIESMKSSSSCDMELLKGGIYGYVYGKQQSYV